MELKDYENLRKVFNNIDDKRSVKKLEDYESVVDGEAFKDFTIRTVKGLKKEDFREPREWLAQKIFNYINDEKVDELDKSVNNPEDFDAWHKKICETFCEKVKEESSKDIFAGKAQKILNMTLKYVFCFKDASEKLEKFKYCHMVLDRYTLELWFLRKVKPWYNNKKEKEETNGISIKNKNIDKWSNLKYEPTKDKKTDKLSYITIQKIIGKYLKDKNIGLTPFEMEFYVWQEEKILEWLKKGEKILGKGFDSFPQHENEEIQALCNPVKQNIDLIEKKFASHKNS